MATITKKGPKIRSTEKSEEFKLKSIEIFKDVKSKYHSILNDNNVNKYSKQYLYNIIFKKIVQ